MPAARQPQLLGLLQQEDGTAVREAEAELDESRMTVWRWLDQLRGLGIVEQRGSGRGARWHMMTPVADTGDPPADSDSV